MSTRVPGHALRGEGGAHDDRGIRRWPTESGMLGRGKCECGVLSPAVLTNAQRKRWHRWHKEQVTRAEITPTDAAAHTFVLSDAQLCALRELLALVHYDDLANAWLLLLPPEFYPPNMRGAR